MMPRPDARAEAAAACLAAATRRLAASTPACATRWLCSCSSASRSLAPPRASDSHAKRARGAADSARKSGVRMPAHAIERFFFCFLAESASSFQLLRPTAPPHAPVVAVAPDEAPLAALLGAAAATGVGGSGGVGGGGSVEGGGGRGDSSADGLRRGRPGVRELLPGGGSGEASSSSVIRRLSAGRAPSASCSGCSRSKKSSSASINGASFKS